ncbi:MAG: prepilin-type N-terminal cleavage/methylation domain-containing protein [bacterium]|nr:prepilin-type N-terminal cleavage/methylation domain-containing protein [bacterium]
MSILNSIKGLFVPTSNRKNPSEGFTLVELLVVIAIIGILATLLLLQLTVARGKARDVKRISDINQMRTSVELYFDDNAQYPDTNNFGTLPSFSPTYINQIPQDPLAVSGCTAGVYNGTDVGSQSCYGYTWHPTTSAPTRFQLWAELEQWTAALGSDADINSLSGGTWPGVGGGANINGTLDASSGCSNTVVRDCVYDQGTN